MISLTLGNGSLVDQSALLDEEDRQLVQAAMTAGMKEFTTLSHSGGHVEWIVQRWVIAKAGKPTAFLVATKKSMPHFQIIGPEVDLGTVAPATPAPTTLQRRPAGTVDAVARPALPAPPRSGRPMIR